MTHLRLHINPVRSSHAGTYTCTSSVVFPHSTKQDSVDVIVKCKSKINASKLKVILYQKWPFKDHLIMIGIKDLNCESNKEKIMKASFLVVYAKHFIRL